MFECVRGLSIHWIISFSQRKIIEDKCFKFNGKTTTPPTFRNDELIYRSSCWAEVPKWKVPVGAVDTWNGIGCTCRHHCVGQVSGSLFIRQPKELWPSSCALFMCSQKKENFFISVFNRFARVASPRMVPKESEISYKLLSDEDWRTPGKICDMAAIGTRRVFPLFCWKSDNPLQWNRWIIKRSRIAIHIREVINFNLND